MARQAKDRPEVASVVNLFAHPAAGLAAWSAFGIGIASHAAGFWMGALNGASGVAQRLMEMDTAERSSGEAAKAEPAAAKTASALEPAVDDLKAIAGVGPKLESVLNGLGVRSFEQIAAWTGDDVRSVEKALGLEGRIMRGDWIGQAAALVATKAKV